MRTIDAIVIHCTATPVTMDIGVKEIREWHLARGWSDIGYHDVIRRNGILELGRPIERQGAHVKGFNEFSIGIALVGGVARDNWTPEDNFTRAQIETATKLCFELMLRYDIPLHRILGHKEVINNITHGSPKACPVLDMEKFRRHLKTVTAGESEVIKQKDAFDRGFNEGYAASVKDMIAFLGQPKEEKK